MGKKYDLSRLSIEDIFTILSERETDLWISFDPVRGKWSGTDDFYSYNGLGCGYIVKKTEETFKDFYIRFLEDCLKNEDRFDLIPEDRVMNIKLKEILKP